MPRTIRTTTAATPAPDPILREKVREALCALPEGRRAPLFMLRDLVNHLIPVSRDAVDILAAVIWNEEKKYVSHILNEDMEREEYFITPAGRVKQQQGWSH